MKVIRYILLLAMLLASVAAEAQEKVPRLRDARLALPRRVKEVRVDTVIHPNVGKGHYTYATILDGDTVPLYQMNDVKIYASGLLLTPKELKNNKKLIKNVRLMLPYAQEGRRRLDALEVEIAALPKKDRKAAIKKAEHDLLAEYKDEISNYTFSQGLVLIKLIDRETNRTAYAIVGELRGSLRAGLYQTLAKLFGYNLKDTFAPRHNAKDDLIDRICLSIERGQL
jgi:hypothetical protein